MTIDLSPEDLQKAEAIVASGRVSTIEEALRAGLSLLEWELNWSAEAQATIDEGVAAASNNDFADDAELDHLFASYQRKSA